MAKVRLGFAGAGWWAMTNHMPILRARDDVAFVAVYDPNETSRGAAAEQFGFGVATGDYDELLRQELDGVIVSSPHHAHAAQARGALERGFHVMVEKPMTLHATDAWALVDLARRRELQLLVPYGWNYKSFTEEAKRWMDEGAVGQIEYVLCHMASPTKRLFAGDGQPPAQDRGEIGPDPATWQTKEHGGGYGHGQLTHACGLMFWLTDLRAETVSGRTASPDAGVDLYDAAWLRLSNGALGTLSGAATLPDGDRFQVDVRIFGSEGVLLLDVERERLELRRHDGRHRQLDIPAGEGAYDCIGPPNRFVDVIGGDRRVTNNSTGETGARVVEVIEAIFRSSESGGAAVAIDGTLG